MKRAVVLGLGISGVTAASFMIKKGYSIALCDDNIDHLNNVLEKLKNENKVCDITICNDVFPKDIDLLVVSPGIPRSHLFYREAKKRSIDIAGEIELASRYLQDETVIAVTGTNGKSTTVTLIRDMLAAAGKKVFLGGNIGRSMLDGVEKGFDYFVLELSSFQLEALNSLKLDIAVILNITPDHLDRYSGFKEYAETKFNIASFLKNRGLLVLNGEDKTVLSYAKKTGKKTEFFSGEKASVSSDGKKILYDKGEISLKNTPLQGEHNLENIKASIVAVSKFVEKADAEKAINEFKTLAHRTEFVRKLDGISFFNDSKGTNVGATEKSLRGFDDSSVILIMGGVDKGGSYAPLLEPVLEKCRKLILIGESAEIIANEFKSKIDIEIAYNDMGLAVKKAFIFAESSNTVLLSPACSSYDMFKNYRERGDEFSRIVNNLTLEDRL